MEGRSWMDDWKSTALGIIIFMFWAFFLVAIAPVMGATQSFIMFYLELSIIPIIVFLPQPDPSVGLVQGIVLMLVKILFFMGNTNIFTTAMIFFIALSMIIQNGYEMWKREEEPDELAFIDSSNEDLHPMAGKDSEGNRDYSLGVRILPMIGFTICILFSVLVANAILVPVPSAFGMTAQQMNEFNDTYSAQPNADTFLSSLPVAFIEDVFTVILVMTFIKWGRLLVYRIVGFSESTIINIFIMLGGLVIGSWIFSSAHYTNPEYISNPEAKQSAFMFSFINTGIFLLTGLLLPIPHAVHNGIALQRMYHAMTIPLLFWNASAGVFFFIRRKSLSLEMIRRPIPITAKGISKISGILILAVIIILAVVGYYFVAGMQAYSFTTNDCAYHCQVLGYGYTPGNQCYCTGTTFAVRCDGNHMVYEQNSIHCGYGCGNGICDVTAGENTQNCIQDCGYCGDSVCYTDESYYTCPQDCTGGGTLPGGECPPLSGCPYCDVPYAKKCENGIISSCEIPYGTVCSGYVWMCQRVCELGCWGSDQCIEDKYHGTIGISVGEVKVRV